MKFNIKKKIKKEYYWTKSIIIYFNLYKIKDHYNTINRQYEQINKWFAYIKIIHTCLHSVTLRYVDVNVYLIRP